MILKKTVLIIAIVLVPMVVVRSDTNFVGGAWLQDHIKWFNAPRDINPHLQSGGAAVLYFGRDKSFALIYCTVGREPGAYFTISHGDPQNVYFGKWESNGEISVEYRLVSRTVQLKGEELPGPIQHATIGLSHEVLKFDKHTFHRVSGLDESAVELLRGVPSIQP